MISKSIICLPTLTVKDSDPDISVRLDEMDGSVVLRFPGDLSVFLRRDTAETLARDILRAAEESHSMLVPPDAA